MCIVKSVVYFKDSVVILGDNDRLMTTVTLENRVEPNDQELETILFTEIIRKLFKQFEPFLQFRFQFKIENNQTRMDIHTENIEFGKFFLPLETFENLRDCIGCSMRIEEFLLSISWGKTMKQIITKLQQ